MPRAIWTRNKACEWLIPSGTAGMWAEGLFHCWKKSLPQRCLHSCRCPPRKAAGPRSVWKPRGLAYSPAWRSLVPAPSCCIWNHKSDCVEYFRSIPGLVTSVSWKQQRQLNNPASKTLSSSPWHQPGASNPIAASPMSVISSDTLHPVFMNDFLLCAFALGTITAYQEIKHGKLACRFVSWAPGEQQVLGLLACPKKTVALPVQSPVRYIPATNQKQCLLLRLWN